MTTTDQPKKRRPKKQPKVTARGVALDLLAGVLHRRQALDLLFETDQALSKLSVRDQAMARMIVLTTLRRLGGLDVIIGRLLERPLPPKAQIAQDLLRIGLTQILYMNVPDHAAVDQTVGLAQARGAGPYKAMINAILRRAARERSGLMTIGDSPGIGLPTWLFQRWQDHYGPETAADIAQALLHPAPLDISVKETPEDWAAALGAEPLPTGTLRLRDAQPVPGLPGFAEGAWWVQDAAAAIPPMLLGNVRGKTVLDICAAPGGKTAWLAAKGAKVIAVDRSAPRMKRLQDNMDRLGLAVEVIVDDATDLTLSEPVDAILLDAPCSATGTLRRHPDTAWLKRDADIAKLGGLQSRLITRAADLLKPGGTLVFCTCSLEAEEGPDQIDRALRGEGPGLRRHPITVDDFPALAPFITADGDIRTLPSHWPDFGGLDGFFAARLTKLD